MANDPSLGGTLIRRGLHRCHRSDRLHSGNRRNCNKKWQRTPLLDATGSGRLYSPLREWFLMQACS
jgi:hypothetical protein